jgi:PAS domain S-box-containing protein
MKEVLDGLVRHADGALLPTWPRWALYLMATLLSVGTLLVRMAIATAFAQRPLLIILVIPIIVSAILGGLGPSLLATALVALGSDYLAIPPLGSLATQHGHDLVPWAFLVVNGVLVSVFAEGARRSWRQRSEALAEQLSASRRLEAIIATSNDAIIGKDLNGIVTTWKVGAERLFGYSAAEALGQPITMLFVPGEEDVEQGLLERIRRGEPVSPFEAQRVRKDGSRITVSVTISPILDEAGRLIGASEIARDITARQANELRQRESDLRLRLALDSARMGVWEFNIKTKAIYWSPEIYRYFGVGSTPPIEAAFLAQLVHPEDAPELKAKMDRAIAERSHYRAEYRAGTHGERWILDQGEVICDAGGDPVQVIGTSMDISALKQAQAAAEQAARAKAAFLAHMTHEIRTPMNAILGLAEVAQHKAVLPEVRDHLAQIRQAASHLLAILNAVLDHSRIEAGRLTLDSAPFECAGLLATLRGLFQQAAGAKALVLAIEVAPGVPRFLVGDALRLQQVLSNLLDNAVKFTERGEVRLRVIDLAPGARPARLRWSVSDTGIGMDAATQARLFEPFDQGDASIARRFGGVGLGLSICRDLLRLMGSELTVDSAPGRGSTFAFDLVLDWAESPPLDVAASSRAAGKQLAGQRLLVVENDPINQRVISGMLGLLGLRFTLAHDGKEALRRLAETAYDAVLMDIQMPGMDGLTATRHIRAKPHCEDLPVIALTAGVTAGERERIVAAGMNDLLPKPLTLDALRATLARWLGTAPVTLPDATLPEVDLTLEGFDLSNLLQGMRARDACDFLHHFAASVRGEVDAIAGALAAGEHEEATARLHRLRGSAAMIGASALQEAGARLESVVKAGDDAQAALTNLRAVHAAALAAIAELPLSPEAGSHRTPS